jgi:hypothetical protein
MATHECKLDSRIGQIGQRAAAKLWYSLRVAILVGLVGCAGAASVQETDPPKVTSDGLVEVSRTRSSGLWVKSDHHLGRYDDVLINVAGFLYEQGQEPLKAKQEREIRAMLAQAVLGITASGPVGVASRSGSCVVRVDVGLKDLRLHMASDTGSSVSYVSSFGATTMIVEFRDSLSNTPLVRYAAHRGLGGGPGTGQKGADLNRLGKALGQMMTDMTTELQEIVPDTTAQIEHDCNDGIYKLTGRG